MTEEEKLREAFEAGVQAERDRAIRLIKHRVCAFDAEFSDGFSELLQLMAWLENGMDFPIKNSEL